MARINVVTDETANAEQKALFAAIQSQRNRPAMTVWRQGIRS